MDHNHSDDELVSQLLNGVTDSNKFHFRLPLYFFSFALTLVQIEDSATLKHFDVRRLTAAADDDVDAVAQNSVFPRFFDVGRCK